MKTHQFILCCILSTVNPLIYANCGDENPFTGGEINLENSTFIVADDSTDNDDDNDVPSEWLFE